MTNPLTPEQIHGAVREHYAGRARQVASGADCCAPAAGCCSPNYADVTLLDLPTSVTDLSLGCGDPVSQAALRSGEVALDLGSGGGIDCFLAARQVGPAGRVIGVDMTDEMLARARANAAKLNAANVEFRRGQIEALPVDDASADVILSNCVINLSPDKPQVFREMYRVLRPGGRVSVSDIVTRGPMAPLVASGLQAWAACVAGALPAEEYRAGLEATGFVDVAVTPREGGVSGLLARFPLGTPFSALITARKP